MPTTAMIAALNIDERHDNQTYPFMFIADCVAHRFIPNKKIPYFLAKVGDSI
ncbi:hypothetical protein VSF3289_03382 [Vibrio scophthalmi]|uniref:Uncharacterized protein n=1 Tax=Vibrio scophthalmi TaxID=45658 RepID=A0A1E3WEM6_9VIBR|nr:hypothetical protein VSF3289_03382 [Vibrio scophthalmi]